MVSHSLSWLPEVPAIPFWGILRKAEACRPSPGYPRYKLKQNPGWPGRIKGIDSGFDYIDSEVTAENGIQRLWFQVIIRQGSRRVLFFLRLIVSSLLLSSFWTTASAQANERERIRAVFAPHTHVVVPARCGTGGTSFQNAKATQGKLSGPVAVA